MVAVLAVSLAGGPASSGAKRSPAAVVSSKHLVITIQNYAYRPASVAVRAGTTITVVNRDPTQPTLTADNGAFDTGTIQPGQSKQLTLRRPGSFSYHCAFHAFMTGTLRVVS